MADQGAQESKKYTATWSLPSKIIHVGKGQLEVLEYGTGHERKVPASQVRLLPLDVPQGLRELNWTHIHHYLPKRWIQPCELGCLPPVYHDLVFNPPRKPPEASTYPATVLPPPAPARKRQATTLHQEE